MNDKKTQLIEASIDLFSKEGFWNTPTSKIAKHAKVATGTLFNYFPSKDALIDAVFLQLKDEISDYLALGYPDDDGVKTCLNHLYGRYVEWGVNHSARYALLSQLKLSNLVSEAAQLQFEEDNRFMYQLVEAGYKQDLFVDIPLDYLTAIILSLTEAALNFALTLGLRGEYLTQHIEQSFNICWQAITQ